MKTFKIERKLCSWMRRGKQEKRKKEMQQVKKIYLKV